MKLPIEDRIRMGKAAELLLTDSNVRAVIEALHLEYYRDWRKLPSTEAQSADPLFYKSKALEDLVSGLEAIRDDGEFAQRELQSQTKR